MNGENSKPCPNSDDKPERSHRTRVGYPGDSIDPSYPDYLRQQRKQYHQQWGDEDD